MAVSIRTYSISMLALSVVAICYMLFVLIIVPILPLDEDNILSSFSQTPILLVSGICGLLFCGSLSVFTIFVMFRGHWTQYWNTMRSKLSKETK